MLEYRLDTHNDHVDCFILVEAKLTHNGKPKPLFFQDNKARFIKYLHKIIHIVVDDLKNDAEHNKSQVLSDEVWKNENLQRNSINKGILQLKLDDKDYIAISDVDEIINPNLFQYLKTNPSGPPAWALQMDMYYYNLSCLNKNEWVYPKIMNYSFYKNELKSTPQICRTHSFPCVIQNAGWHLSYFGDAKFIKNKLLHFAHQEWNHPEYTDESSIEEKIRSKKDLFSRSEEEWNYVPLDKNNRLPPNYNKYPFLTNTITTSL
jgi:beta-1,4-mannosyl-glycoprotein beta-1,4-N-acetylglucosaminyltransferase